MNFEDRLKNELQNQSAQISIEPAGVDDIASRSAKRRQRRMAGMAAAVALVLLGVGGFVVNNRDGSTPLALEATAEEAASEESSDEAAESSDDSAESPDVEDGRPLPGAPLDFVNIESGTSPGGFGLYGTGVIVGDAYYILSTAPGKADPNDFSSFRPDTLYKFDGAEWSNSSFDDRFISSLSSDGNVLYTVSTGTRTADTPAIGSSADGGDTWNWTPIDVTEQFGADPSAWPYFDIVADSSDGATFAVVRHNEGVDWEEAIALANDAGAGINPETDAIMDLNVERISWIPDQFLLSPCAQVIDDAMTEFVGDRSIDEEISRIYGAADATGELSAEDQARIDELSRQMDEIYQQAYADALEAARATGDCDAYVDCAQSERELSAASFGPESVVETTTIPADDQQEPAEEFTDADYAAYEDAYTEWIETSGCGEILGYGEEFDDGDVESVTWAELGVEVPSSWYGSTAAHLVTEAGSQSLGVFADGEAGWLQSVDFDGTNMVATFSGVWTQDHEENGSAPESTVYSSTDGVTWDTSTQPCCYRPTPFNGTTFTIDWTEEETSLVRNGPNGSERLSLRDLAPNLDTEDAFFNRVFVGEYGVVITASKWDDDGEFGTAHTIIFYSSDGESFGATLLEGRDVSTVMIGDDGVIVFANNQQVPNSDSPQPVLFGTAS